jgi:hypothetical protein
MFIVLFLGTASNILKFGNRKLENKFEIKKIRFINF